MIRIGSRALVMLITFVVAIAVSRLATKANLVSDDAVTLWVSAIMAGEGEMSIGRIVAAYPTIPFLATSSLEFITPLGTPAPLFLTAGVLALLAGAWLAAFRRAGLPLIVKATVVMRPPLRSGS